MIEKQNETIKVGIVLDSMREPAWVHRLISEIRESGYAEISTVWIRQHQTNPQSLADRLAQHHRHFFYTVYEKIDYRMSRPKPDAFAACDLQPLLDEIHPHHITTILDKDRHQLDEKELAKLPEQPPDVLLWLTSGIPAGRITTLPRFGTWCLQPTEQDGARAGFWEVIEQKPTTAANILVITPQGEEYYLQDSYLVTNQGSVSLNRNTMAWKCVAMVPQRLRQLHQQGFAALMAHLQPGSEREENRRDAPKNLAGIGLIASLALKRTGNKLTRMARKEQWQLMIERGPGFPTQQEEWTFQPIKPPRDRFWADPFIVYHQGKHFIFIEEYTWRERKGYISAMEIEGDRVGPVQTVLKRPYHLSYPFVFNYKDTWYMIPESRQNHSIEVYRCEAFPLKWEYSHALMEGVEAVDSTLIQHGEHWWLFTNMAANHGASTNDELYLFYADNPLSKSWQPHPANPIVTDARGARPAGKIIAHDGTLYRPAQDCTSGENGDPGVRFHRIECLSTTEYKEREVAYLQPDFERSVKRIHTYNQAGGLSIIDGLVSRLF